MKKFILFLLVFLPFLAGCQDEKKSEYMDRPASDGRYYYENKDLGFALTLPEEFIYYQTQREEGADFTDIEVFVPTSDTSISGEVPGYAKPIIVRVAEDKQSLEGEDFEEIFSQDEKFYGLKFWDKAPRDWYDKWTPEMKEDIKSEFKSL